MIGTIPEERPKIGMNTKDWSLKYTLKMDTAVVLKPMRIAFIAPVIMVPILLVMIVGAPTAYMDETILLLSFK